MSETNTTLKLLDGNCPHCGNDALVPIEGEYIGGNHFVNTARCDSCGKKVSETYSLTDQEIIEED